MNLKEKLIEATAHNASLFLKEGVKKLIDQSTLSKDDIVLSCANIQIALELSARCFIIRTSGLNAILDKKQQQLNDEEILQLYNDDKLKVLEFDALKKQLKGKDVTNFNKIDYQYIDEFQKYRNKIVHLSYDFDSSKLEYIKNRLIFYVVHHVMYLLYYKYSDLKPAEFFQDLFGYDFYRAFWNNVKYKEAIETLANEECKNLGACPICGEYTYNMDDEYCYFCNTIREQYEWGRTDCDCCGGHNTVIYDTLNIHCEGNHHTMTGVCQKCEEKTEVFECPKCGTAHTLYRPDVDKLCSEEHCIYCE